MRVFLDLDLYVQNSICNMGITRVICAVHMEADVVLFSVLLHMHHWLQILSSCVVNCSVYVDLINATGLLNIILCSLNNVVGIATGYELEDIGVGVRVPALYPMCTGCYGM
jgi:hypothetical protein